MKNKANAWTRADVSEAVDRLQWLLLDVVADELGCVICRRSVRDCDHSQAWDQATRDGLTRTIWSFEEGRLEEIMRAALASGWRPQSAGEIPCPECGVGPFLPCVGPWPEEGLWDTMHKARERAWAAWKPPRIGQLGLGEFA